MPVSNPWLTPYQRSFNDIKAKLTQSLRSRVPEMTDLTEGNIFVIIISIWSAMAEVLHYYIDNMGRETFVTTARRYSSLYKHAQLVDYRIKSATAASVDLILFRKNREAIDTDILIPEGVVFESNDGKKWEVSKTYNWPAGSNVMVISVIQRERYPATGQVKLGNFTENNQAIYLGDLPTGRKYIDGTMCVYINGVEWTSVDSFSQSTPVSKVFKVEVDESQKPYIKFGDGFFGRKPDHNSEVSAHFYITYGKDSNIAENMFSAVPTELSNVYNDIQVNNTSKALGGSDYESFNILKSRIPLSVKTLGVAITKEDYESITMLHPQVDKAYVNYICGRYVEVYVTPRTEEGVGGVASKELLDSVFSYLTNKKVLTTSVTVKSTYPTKIYIKATITGLPSYNTIDILNQVKQALINNYNYNTSDINKAIRLSDLYALVDNQSMVDYLTIDQLYLIPTPQNSATNNGPSLVISSYRQISYTSDKPNWEVRVRIVSSSEYRLEYVEDGNSIPLPDVINNNRLFNKETTVTTDYFKFAMTLSNANTNYVVDDIYSLSIQPMNKDLVPSGFSIPIFYSENIELTINETV